MPKSPNVNVFASCGLWNEAPATTGFVALASGHRARLLGARQRPGLSQETWKGVLKCPFECSRSSELPARLVKRGRALARFAVLSADPLRV